MPDIKTNPKPKGCKCSMKNDQHDKDCPIAKTEPAKKKSSRKFLFFKSKNESDEAKPAAKKSSVKTIKSPSSILSHFSGFGKASQSKVSVASEKTQMPKLKAVPEKLQGSVPKPSTAPVVAEKSSSVASGKKISGKKSDLDLSKKQTNAVSTSSVTVKKEPEKQASSNVNVIPVVRDKVTVVKVVPIAGTSLPTNEVSKPSPREVLEVKMAVLPIVPPEKPLPPESLTNKPEPPESLTNKPEPPETLTDKSEPPETITDKPESPEALPNEPEPHEALTNKPEQPDAFTNKPEPPENLTNKPEPIVTTDPTSLCAETQHIQIKSISPEYNVAMQELTVEKIGEPTASPGKENAEATENADDSKVKPTKPKIPEKHFYAKNSVDKLNCLCDLSTDEAPKNTSNEPNDLKLADPVMKIPGNSPNAESKLLSDSNKPEVVNITPSQSSTVSQPSKSGGGKKAKKKVSVVSHKGTKTENIQSAVANKVVVPQNPLVVNAVPNKAEETNTSPDSKKIEVSEAVDFLLASELEGDLVKIVKPQEVTEKQISDAIQPMPGDEHLNNNKISFEEQKLVFAGEPKKVDCDPLCTCPESEQSDKSKALTPTDITETLNLSDVNIIAHPDNRPPTAVSVCETDDLGSLSQANGDSYYTDLPAEGNEAVSTSKTSKEEQQPCVVAGVSCRAIIKGKTNVKGDIGKELSTLRYSSPTNVIENFLFDSALPDGPGLLTGFVDDPEHPLIIDDSIAFAAVTSEEIRNAISISILEEERLSARRLESAFRGSSTMLLDEGVKSGRSSPARPTVRKIEEKKKPKENNTIVSKSCTETTCPVLNPLEETNKTKDEVPCTESTCPVLNSEPEEKSKIEVSGEDCVASCSNSTCPVYDSGYCENLVTHNDIVLVPNDASKCDPATVPMTCRQSEIGSSWSVPCECPGGSNSEERPEEKSIKVTPNNLDLDPLGDRNADIPPEAFLMLAGVAFLCAFTRSGSRSRSEERKEDKREEEE